MFWTFLIQILMITYSYTQCEDRYQSEIFEEVTIDSVVYSDVTGFEMDIYQPVGDVYSQRPLIIFSHSGAFYTGTKNSAFMKSICTKFAKKGYVTASIQYSLAESQDFITDSLYMKDIMVQAVADAKAAIRYFRKSALLENQYKIDTDQIWVGGNSAGSMLSLQLAYLDELDSTPDYLLDIINNHGGFEGDRGNEGVSSQVNGVINLAGAVLELDWIDADEVEPLVSCHGSVDDIVDIGCNDLFWNFGPFAELDLLKFYGSELIHNRANIFGLDNSLLVFDGLNHVPWLVEGDVQDDVVLHIQNFLYDRIDCNIILENDKVENQIFSIYPNPSETSIKITNHQNYNIDQVVIMDLNGKFIVELVKNSDTYTIPSIPIPSGMYLLLINSKQDTFVEKLVLR